MTTHERIEMNPEIIGGKPVIRGNPRGVDRHSSTRNLIRPSQDEDPADRRQ